MVIAPKHVGAVLMQILTFFSSNSLVHQLVNKDCDNIKMHSMTVKKRRWINASQTNATVKLYYFWYRKLLWDGSQPIRKR